MSGIWEGMMELRKIWDKVIEQEDSEARGSEWGLHIPF